MIRTPEQYVQDLRDGRVVYQDGERIWDVPSRYRVAVERSASEFWICNQPEYRSLFNMIEDGEEVSFSFNVPTTGEDLQRRRDHLAKRRRPEPVPMAFAELCVTSNFTFLTGGSHPGEYAVRAAEFGLSAIAIADRNSVAGLGRAYAAGREIERTGGRAARLVPAA